MYRVILPDMYNLKEINFNLFILTKEHKEMLIDPETLVLAVEGSFPFDLWNGGAINTTRYRNILLQPRVEEFKNMFDFHLELYYDCSNPLLTETDLISTRENMILRELENGSNKIISSSDKVTMMLKEKYPAYLFVASNEYFMYPQNTNLDLYELFKCDYPLLQHEQYAKIPKSKIIVNLNLSCCFCDQYLYCKAQEHEHQYNYMIKSAFNECEKLSISILTPTEIDKLRKQGYHYFNIDFNGLIPLDPDEIINIYLDLFIKPEYREKAIPFLKRGNFND